MGGELLVTVLHGRLCGGTGVKESSGDREAFRALAPSRLRTARGCTWPLPRLGWGGQVRVPGNGPGGRQVRASWVRRWGDRETSPGASVVSEGMGCPAGAVQSLPAWDCDRRLASRRLAECHAPLFTAGLLGASHPSLSLSPRPALCFHPHVYAVDTDSSADRTSASRPLIVIAALALLPLCFEPFRGCGELG